MLESLFGAKKTPGVNQIRSMLDPVQPSYG
jgi:hypothetical protein